MDDVPTHWVTERNTLREWQRTNLAILDDEILGYGFAHFFQLVLYLERQRSESKDKTGRYGFMSPAGSEAEHSLDMEALRKWYASWTEFAGIYVFARTCGYVPPAETARMRTFFELMAVDDIIEDIRRTRPMVYEYHVNRHGHGTADATRSPELIESIAPVCADCIVAGLDLGRDIDYRWLCGVGDEGRKAKLVEAEFDLRRVMMLQGENDRAFESFRSMSETSQKVVGACMALCAFAEGVSNAATRVLPGARNIVEHAVRDFATPYVQQSGLFDRGDSSGKVLLATMLAAKCITKEHYETTIAEIKGFGFEVDIGRRTLVS